LSAFCDCLFNVFTATLHIGGRSSIHNLRTCHVVVIKGPFVLYGCETWLLTLRVECRLRMFENRVLRRIFGPKRDEVTGEWRKLHNEELNDLYSYPLLFG